MSTILETKNLDPKTLLVDVNVRSDLALDTSFIASIKEHGVLVPIVAARTDDGIRVRMGHRRTQAAVEARLETVPVVIVDSSDLEGDAADIGRILTQYAENHHRAGLTTGDEIDIHRQLAAFGLSANQIAGKTKTSKKHVEDALIVAESPTAQKALTDNQLTLEEAAVLAEFGDDEEAVSELILAAEDGDIDHVAQRLRDNREIERITTEEAERLTGQGFSVIEAPAYDSPSLSVNRLSAADGNKIDKDAHTSCPGHAVYIRVRRNWNHDDDSAWTIEEGAVCTDPKGNGHTDQWGSSLRSDKKLAADMSDDEREEAKAERKRVIENNKGWDSGTEVRRAWVKTYLTRKTPSKAGTLLIAQALVERDESIDKRWNGTVHDLIEVKRAAYGRPTLAADASPARQQVIALATILGGSEDSMGRHSWRAVTAGTARYLTFLKDEGYALSDVEKLAAGIE
ncbi:MAG: ParB N-terminal domain-containing protein [Actinomycetota bacterium]|nr:ParB N-terminal domain-containing protein [Actinomycetota bacterium]